MNAQTKALTEERDYLKALIYKAHQPDMPFNIAIDNKVVPTNIVNGGREGLADCLSVYISIRLNSIENELEKLKGDGE